MYTRKFDYTDAGKPLRIHPACDWFMRGVTTATIVKRGLNTGIYYCRDARVRRLIAIRPKDVLEIMR